MNEIFFNDRDGNTVLSAEELSGLRLGHITRMKELDEAEQVNITQGLLWLAGQRKTNYLTDSFFRKLHKQLFGQVWKWAGVYRSTEKNIGIQAYKVPTAVLKLCEDVQYWLDNGSYETSELIARFHHRLVYIHPFPNGNGRFSRILTNYFCKRNGLSRPEWQSHLNPHMRRKLYIQCLQQADLKKIVPLKTYLSEKIEHPERWEHLAAPLN